MFSHSGDVFRVGIVPGVVAATSVYTSSLLRSLLADDQQFVHWLIYAASRLVVLACLATIAVGWHRLILLEERISTVRPSWSRCHTRFWLWSVLLISVASIPNLGWARFASEEFQGSQFSIWLLLVLAFAYCEARIALVLPATAVTHDASASRAWALSHQNGIQIAVASAFVLFPAKLILGMLISFLPDGFKTAEFDLVNSAAITVVGWLILPWFTCVEVGILSHAYRRVTQSAV